MVFSHPDVPQGIQSEKGVNFEYHVYENEKISTWNCYFYSVILNVNITGFIIIKYFLLSQLILFYNTRIHRFSQFSNIL